MPTIHYNLAETGQMVIGDAPPIHLVPHTLVIAPPRQPFRIDVPMDMRRRPSPEQWKRDGNQAMRPGQ